MSEKAKQVKRLEQTAKQVRRKGRGRLIYFVRAIAGKLFLDGTDEPFDPATLDPEAPGIVIERSGEVVERHLPPMDAPTAQEAAFQVNPSRGPRTLEFVGDGQLDAGLLRTEPRKGWRSKYICDGEAHLKCWWHGTTAEQARLEPDSAVVQFTSAAGGRWNQVTESAKAARKVFRALPHDPSAAGYWRRNQDLNKQLQAAQARELREFGGSGRRMSYPKGIGSGDGGRHVKVW